MITSDADHIRVQRSEIDPGQPLPWTVYDSQQNLVLHQGSRVESREQLDTLVVDGLFRQRCPAPAQAAPPGRNTRDVADNGSHDRSLERATRLDEIKLVIGDPFQIQAQAEGSENRYYVRLIGYLKGKSVIVTCPEEDGRLCLVREGQAFVTRFFAGKNAYAFTANVLRSSTVPFPHLHLSYPPQVRALVVRAGERVETRIICAVVVPEGTGAATTAGVITNISVSGALIHSKTPLGRKGDLLSIKFRMEIRGIEFFAVIDTTIRTLSRDDSGDFLHGVQFAGLPNDVAIALTAFVYQKLAQ